MFLFELALKTVMTAMVVVAASVAAERTGPVVGAIITALPTAAGATYVILALEHPPAFVAASAIGSLAAMAAVSIFSITYAALAQRRGLVVSVAVAFIVWLVLAAMLRRIEWTALSAVALNVIVFAAAIALSRQYRAAGPPPRLVKPGLSQLLLRAAIVAAFVVVVTTASHTIGSFVSGMFAVFPIVMGSVIVILHPRIGGPATASVFAHVQVPLIGLGLGWLTVHYLAVPLGVWWSYAAAIAVIIAWSAMLLAARRARRT